MSAVARTLVSANLNDEQTQLDDVTNTLVLDSIDTHCLLLVGRSSDGAAQCQGELVSAVDETDPGNERHTWHFLGMLFRGGSCRCC